GNSVTIGATPGSGATQTFSGTSAAAPFVSGIVTTAIMLKGAALTNSEIRAQLATTGQSSSDPTVPRMIDSYAFLRTYAHILPDTFEPNDYDWQATTGLPVNDLMTIARRDDRFPDE